MDFKQNIPKYKPKLLSWLLTLAIMLTTFMQYPITTQAAEGADYDAWASAIVDSIGDSTSGGTDKVKNGVKYTRTGYLCYMLTVDGVTVPGTSAIALKSPGYDEIPGAIWICESRQGGYTASTWKGTAPWSLTPWQEGGSPTNEPDIKAWMLEETSSGTPNAYNFVANAWSEEVADKFGEDQYILVIETILHFQYSIVSGNSSSVNAIYDLAMAYVDGMSTNELLREAMKHGYTTAFTEYYSGQPAEQTAMINSIKSTLRTAITRLNLGENYGKYTLVGQPIIANVPNLIKYKQSLGQPQTALDSYTNKVAPISERILPGGPGERAGFVAWTGSTSTKLSNDEVINYGVGMIVVTAKRDGIPTWDSVTYPTGDVGPAPDHPKGKYNIVKNYYTKDGATGEFISDDGCFIREGVVPTIHVVNEPQYQVVGYKTSTTTQSIPSNLWDSWSPPNPQQQKKSTGTVKLESPETCIYVLLERIENPEPEIIDYNYILKESQITRRVYFSFPDEGTSEYKDSPQSNMNSPYIYEHEFRWLSPKVPVCKGHHYMDDCPWHDPGHNGNCLEDCDIDHSFQHDYDCVDATAYCKDPDWEEKRLLLSINNILQEDYQNVLVPQSTWNREVELEKETKHYYKDDQPFDRQVLEDIEWHPESGGYPNWDYI